MGRSPIVQLLWDFSALLTLGVLATILIAVVNFYHSLGTINLALVLPGSIWSGIAVFLTLIYQAGGRYRTRE